MEEKRLFRWFLCVLSLLLSCGVGRAQKAELVVQMGHSKGLWCSALSPNGRWFASGGGDGTIKIWDVKTTFLLRTLRVGSGYSRIEQIAFTPNSQTLIFRNETAHLWNFASDGKVFNFSSSGWVRCFALSPNGKTLATGCGEGTILLWDVANLKVVKVLKDKKVEIIFRGKKFDLGSWINGISFSPDGKILASGSQNGQITLWNLRSSQTQRIRPNPMGKNPLLCSIEGVAFSLNNELLAVVDGNGWVWVWNLRLHQMQRIISKSSNSSFMTMSFNRNGNLLLTAQRSGIRVWNVTSDKLLRTWEGFTGTLNSTDDNVIIGSEFWRITDEKPFKKFSNDADETVGAAFSPDGHRFATCSWSKGIVLWDVRLGQAKRLPHDYAYEGGIAFSPNSQHIAAGTWGMATVLIVDSETGAEHSDIFVPPNIEGLTFSPDGKTLITHSFHSPVIFWDISTRKEKQRVPDTDSFYGGLALSPDGKTLALSNDTGVRIWDVSLAKFRATLPIKDVTALAYSPDGKTFASIQSRSGFQFWDSQSGKPLSKLLPCKSVVTTVAFSPDGKYLLASCVDSSVLLWDVALQRLSLTIYPMVGNDYVVVDPQGRFDGTPDGLEQLHYVAGLEPIALDQLKERYYTPGLWAKTLGTDQDAIPAVPRFNEVKLYPDIELVPPALGQTKMQVRLKNQGGGLGRVEIKVGGKELVADARGKGFDPNAAMGTLQVDLAGTGAVGEKVSVEVVAWNADGDVRSRGVELEYIPPGKRHVVKPRFFAIVVGASRFPSNPSLNLQFSSKDADDMAEALDLGAHDLFSESHIRLLSSDATSPADKPTRDNIARAFADVAAQARESDVLVVYFSGHGVGLRVSGRDYYCYLTQDAREVSEDAFADPAVREVSTITSDDLATWTNPRTGIKVQKQVLILDTCAAGAVAARLDQQRDTDADVVRAVDRLNERSGFYVLMGCAASAKSFEANRFGQGILTYSLLQGVKGAALRDGRFVDVSKLFTFAQDGAESLAKSVGLFQQPRTMTGSGQTFDIGDLDQTKRDQIPLARAKPVLLRPTLQNETEGFDNLELATPVQNALREACLISARGEETPVFLPVEPGEFSEGIKPTINYRIEGNVVKARLIFSQGGKKLGEVEAQGPADPQKRGELVQALVTALVAFKMDC